MQKTLQSVRDWFSRKAEQQILTQILGKVTHAMSVVDDLNTAITNLTTVVNNGFASLAATIATNDAAVQAEITALQAAVASGDTTAIQASIANLSALSASVSTAFTTQSAAVAAETAKLSGSLTPPAPPTPAPAS